MSKDKEVYDRKREAVVHDDDRIHGLRSLEERERIKRNIMNMYGTNPYYIPIETIPPDLDYLWVRESLLGEPDNSNMALMRSLGWEPVPATRHPERQSGDFFGRLDHMKEYIFRRGLVLCQRPKEFGDHERKILHERSYQIMKSTPGLDSIASEPTMPIYKIKDELSFSRGYSSAKG